MHSICGFYLLISSSFECIATRCKPVRSSVVCYPWNPREIIQYQSNILPVYGDLETAQQHGLIISIFDMRHIIF